MVYSDQDMDHSGMNRREILQAGLMGSLGGLLWAGLSSGTAEASIFSMPKAGAFPIAFRNQHTGESFSGAYRVGNRYLPEAFKKINHILRDFRTEDEFPIDPRVIDIAYMVHQKTGINQPYEVLSGYRSPRTNATLRRTSAGVAKNSLHLTGQAMDFRLPGYRTSRLRDIAVNLRAGGVGYYKGSNFLHIDTGKIRHW